MTPEIALTMFFTAFPMACNAAAFYLLFSAYGRRHDRDGLTMAVIALGILVALK